MMFTTLKYRPIIIAERHNASAMTYAYYCYLKSNPKELFDYCLFEGALDTDTHLENTKNACNLYYQLVSDFLSVQNKSYIKQFIHDDLSNEYTNFMAFATQYIDTKKYPYGFGQIRNLTTHFLLYTHLKQHNTQWIAIDDKRSVIKKCAEQSIANGTAYLYKRHKNIGEIKILKQKILLEAAPLRSKYMSDKILEYASKWRCLVLMGNRHALDITLYTPDLADIFGYNPNNDNDDLLYYYNIHYNPVRYDLITNNTQFNHYHRPIDYLNTQKIRSDFNINNFYLDKLKYIFTN